MSLWVCLDCTTAFAVGAPRCPHCGSERHAEEQEAERLGIRHGVPVEIEEENMPKITRHEGASVADVTVNDEAPEANEGGEDVSAGVDTATSSEKPSKKPAPSGTRRQSRARTTENP